VRLSTRAIAPEKEFNTAVGEAHEGFCRAKRDVEVLEGQLKETGALEKFESA
jgi:hypothetical protein